MDWYLKNKIHMKKNYISLYAETYLKYRDIYY